MDCSGSMIVGRGLYAMKGSMCFVFSYGGFHKVARGRFDYCKTEPVLNENGKAIKNIISMYLYDMPECCPFSYKMNLQQKNGKIVDTNILTITATTPDYGKDGKMIAQTEPIWASIPCEKGFALFETLIQKKFIITTF